MNTTKTLEGKLSLKETWEALRTLVAGRCVDNLHYLGDGDYPLEVRRQQVISIQALVSQLEEYHALGNKPDKEALINWGLSPFGCTHIIKSCVSEDGNISDEDGYEKLTTEGNYFWGGISKCWMAWDMEEVERYINPNQTNDKV